MPFLDDNLSKHTFSFLFDKNFLSLKLVCKEFKKNADALEHVMLKAKWKNICGNLLPLLSDKEDKKRIERLATTIVNSKPEQANSLRQKINMILQSLLIHKSFASFQETSAQEFRKSREPLFSASVKLKEFPLTNASQIVDQVIQIGVKVDDPGIIEMFADLMSNMSDQYVLKEKLKKLGLSASEPKSEIETEQSGTPTL